MNANATTTNNLSKSPVRIVLFSVMEVSIKEAMKVFAKREDVELALVITCPGPKSRRSDAYMDVIQALYDEGHHNVDVMVSNKKSKYKEILKMYEIDMIMSIGYPWLLPEEILNPNSPQYKETSPRLGAVNFHNAMLPRYKGPNSFGWSVINEDNAFGFCTHRMDNDFDTGRILLEWSMPDKDINKTHDEIFPELVKGVDATIDMMLSEDPGRKQAGQGSYAPKFEDSFRWIDPATLTAREIHNRVRAFYGARDIPLGALTKINGKVMCLQRTFYREMSPERDGSYNRDETENIVSKAKNGSSSSFFIQCKDTTLEVLEWNFPVNCNNFDIPQNEVTCAAA